MAVGQRQAVVVGGHADHGEGATLAFAEGFELGQAARRNGQHVTLLRLVAPDFGRRHARLFDVHVAQFEAGAATGAVREFGQRVGKTAGADVMHREDGVAVAGLRRIDLGRAHLAAAVEHFLRPPFHLRVAALHRGEVEVFGVGAGAHRAGGAAAQTDQHARTAQLDEQRAGREGLDLDRLLGGDAAQTAGDHDRLVIAAHNGIIPAADLLFVGAEVAGQVGATVFVVEGGGADRAVAHDFQRRGDARRTAVGGHRGLPGLLGAGEVEVGDGEAAQAGLGLGAAPGRTFVADFAARAGGRPREG